MPFFKTNEAWLEEKEKKECLPGPAVVAALLSPHNVHGGPLQSFVLKVGQDDSDEEKVLN